MATAVPKQYPQDARVRLVNGRFTDVIGGRYYPAGTSLLLQNGKIISVEPPAPADSPDGESAGADIVIELQGKAVIPGLFNTHAHLQMINGLVDKGEIRQRQIAANLAGCLERGVTHLRDTLCWDLRANRPLVEQIQRRTLPGPRIHQAIHVSPVEGTYAPRLSWLSRKVFSAIGLQIVPYNIPYSGAVVFRKDAASQEVRDAVDRAIDERGAEMIKFCDQPEKFPNYGPGAAVITQAQLDAAVDQARKRGAATTIHNVTVDGFRKSIRAGMDSLAHVPCDQELTDADLKLFNDATCAFEPTLSVAYYYSWNMKGNPWQGHPEIDRLDSFRDATYVAMAEESWIPEVRQNFIAQRESLKAGNIKIYGVIDLSQPFHFLARYMPVGGANFRRIFQDGGRERTACGNDATVSGCSQGAIHLEMELMDFCLNPNGQHDFSGVDALRIATIQSARALGLEDTYGSLEPGKAADLAVLDGDPLADYHQVGSPVAALFMDGRLVVNHCGL